MRKILLLVLFGGMIAGAADTALVPSPAEAAIARAQALIEKQPDHIPYRADLAMAYARRARETSDVKWYTKAEAVVDDGLSRHPDDFDLMKVRAWLQLGRHEFAAALKTATALNSRAADDVTVYGYLADANTELGNYREAVQAVQWMLNIRPGNTAGLTRASYLRELHGDIEGALELMRMVLDSAPMSEHEDRAWIETQIGHLYLVDGKPDRAEKHALEALQLFPRYHYALGLLGQVRMAQGRPREASEAFAERFLAAPHAENQFALAQALAAAGQEREAERNFVEFEKKSLAESELADNSNHELILYYVDVAHRPEQALAIARKELARRHDINTLDCYAWALAANGEQEQAAAQIKEALATKASYPQLLRHAAAIAGKRQLAANN